ncbi:hypothetical protein J5N97_003171 [Dioscorea zingiberensis]|uniref:Uncharacterized protein n=1 Tax=Dioscorea zingiberensis TaxID=325984 RepID=A0A9D5D3L4_9LILI|nr:hypothetical protein J5N97_003171 [Dioscorea zingiberensis]
MEPLASCKYGESGGDELEEGIAHGVQVDGVIRPAKVELARRHVVVVLVECSRQLGFLVDKWVAKLNALLLEIVMTFGLVYTVYATAVDPKRGNLVTIPREASHALLVYS